MAEPSGHDPRPKPNNNPRTAGLQQLFERDVFERKGHEQGPWQTEQKRDALVAVKDSQGRHLQFILQVTLDIRSKALYISIGPTNGAVDKYPELKGIQISHTGSLQDSVEAVVQVAFGKMKQAGYQLVNGR